jgi:aminoglycoside phosphotransferase (APT) family kinase protein
MHEGEVESDAEQVRRLLAAQFPHWAELPITRIDHSGTDHAIYRLGDDLAARLPVIEWATAQAEKEATWLPRLAPHLPAALPVPCGLGQPGEGYPWRWSVVPWLPGDNPAAGCGDAELARDLAAFIVALRAIDAEGAPPARNRGWPLRRADEQVRASLDQLHDDIDVAAVTAVWDDALAAPEYAGPPRWIHGDLLRGNLLVHEGNLAGVIDWGSLCAADPACDLHGAFSVFDRAGRQAFRDAMDVDDASWRRARGWAVNQAVLAMPYYRDTNPGIVENSRVAIDGVLDD